MLLICYTVTYKKHYGHTLFYDVRSLRSEIVLIRDTQDTDAVSGNF